MIAVLVALGGVARADGVLGRIVGRETTREHVERTVLKLDVGTHHGVTRHHIGCLLVVGKEQCRVNAIVIRVAKNETFVVVDLPVGSVDTKALVRLYPK